MDRIDKDEELVCPLCGGRLFWMPVSLIYACEHCKQSYSERNGVYMRKKRESTAEKSSAVGDAAKLREALVSVKKSIDDMGAASLDGDPEVLLMSPTQVCARLSARIDSVLSAPPRNCDRFATETDAQIAFLNDVWLISVTKETALERDRFENWTDEMRSRYARWLVAPATEKEGGNDGNE